MRKSLVAFAALSLALWMVVWAIFRTPSYAPLTVAERAAVMARLRGQGGAAVPPRPLAGPLFAVLYADGAPTLRLESHAPTLAAAVDELAPRLARPPAGRLKVDVTLARAPIRASPAPLFALSLVPGIDGIGVRLDADGPGRRGREIFLTVDDLMRADALAAAQPLQAMEFELGASRDQIDHTLAQALGLDDDAFARLPRSYFRFRTDAFIEPAQAAPAAAPLPVVRGNTPGPSLSKETLLAGAVAGGRYLLRHLYDDGRFGYEYTPARDQDEAYGLDYSLPRHAGATYFLAQLYGATHDVAFQSGADRALRFLAARQPDACGRADRSCVANRETRYADLGATAMALLAVTEHEASTGDRALMPWARRLANFILYMQKEDGDFCHLFDPGSDRRDEKTKMLYFSGEAAFALAKLSKLVGGSDPEQRRYAAALDRGLDYLTGKQYAHLAGQFYFGEDHWTCMAADAGWDALPPSSRERYADFCDRFVAFLRRTQFTPGDRVVAGQPDFVGAYGFSPFLPPHATPVGSRSETTVSTYLMQQRRGRANSRQGRATLEQIRLGMQFLLDHQIRDDDAYLMANPEAARGGFLMSDVKRYIRVDFVQHSCSAMLRAIPLL